MRKIVLVVSGLLLLTAPLLGQAKRLWVLRSPGEIVEYDPATFAAKQTVKLPAAAVESPGTVSVNRLGQILYSPAVSLPLSEEDAASAHKVWIWNGRSATTIDQGVKRDVNTTGSNQAVTELAPVAYLSADGGHLFWFANQAHRLQRDEVDLSTVTTWQAWRTDLNGAGREDIATSKFLDCRCPTGTCEESCPYAVVWAPETGVDKLFLMTQFVAGQTAPVYKSTSRYQEEGGKWTADPLAEPLQRVLDAASDGSTIAEAIPDTGCCGWSNQSDDQTLVLTKGKKLTVFDELATYKNPDYDVSFYTSNARLSPQWGSVAMTIVSTAESNKPIQLAEQGQANPEESQRIRKALAELPAVEVKSMDDAPRRVAFIPHAVLVGWLSEKEILILEDHTLAAYNVETGARRKSTVRVDDAAQVFLR
ncbi:MAG TPA: hypothetical protein VKF84_10245 [Candidatus Sulfotelmatobacter sp.]|nr:hypothetical protein [Candidatus Sulfotelmatobacter sp.]